MNGTANIPTAAFSPLRGRRLRGRGQIADVEVLDEPKQKQMTNDIIGGLLQTQQRSCVL